MLTTSPDTRYRYYVAIYRCDVTTAEAFVAVCGKVKVELFHEERTYYPSEYRPAVIAAVLKATYCFPVHPPIQLDTKSRHLVLTSRTRLGREEAQAACEAAIDQVIAVVAALYSPDILRTLLFRGWLRGPANTGQEVLFRAVKPITLSAKELERCYVAASGKLAQHPLLRYRFALMSRFVAKGLAESPGEEAFVFLWTALEVFPMVNTTDIRPISRFLSSYVGRPEELLKEKLRIGWLFGMRSKLVHDGHLPLARHDKFSALTSLERLVRAVIRHASGLPYDGAFDFAFKPK